MSTFRPLSTRGAFVASSMPGAGARPFLPLDSRATRPFAAGLMVRPAEPALQEEMPLLEGDGAPEQADPATTAAPEVHAPETRWSEAAYPPPVSSAAARLQAEAVAEAVRLSESAASEFAEREAAREAEHAHLLADLEAQKQKTRAANERLGQLAGDLVRVRQALVEELRTTAGTLLLTGARRLANDSLRAQPGLLEEIVTEIVGAMAADMVTVRVNPADVERLAAVLGDRVRVTGDATVSAGCIAHGDAGSVDASIDAGIGALAAEVSAWKRTA